MKKLVTLFAFLGLFLASPAHPVDVNLAKEIAAKFMETNDLQLVTIYKTDRNVAALYVFNTANGFVIVAADDCETPIIGYSHEGRFDPNNVPVQMQDYLQDFVARIQYNIENQIVADKTTAQQWELVKATGMLNNRKNAKAVAPLLTDKWNQGCRYNSLCPTMQGPCDHAEVGCVAVAMGQIMHYWGYPATGWGSHSYTNAGTTLSADFGNTTYDWSHMPDSLTESSTEAEIEAVATLLYHCGVSVDMRYTNNGSNANSTIIPDAMMRYFDYSRHMHREKKTDYSDEEWIPMLKNCLDLQRPVLYSGFGSTGNIGHAFVCDGYDNNDLLHFNWGWGTADGYFALGNLNPLGYNFNNNNSAILDIVPENDPCLVVATVYPPTAGTIEGTGEYHIGEQCTLTAVPAENAKFEYWLKQGRIVSKTESYTFSVLDDIDDIKAIFSYLTIEQITACYYPEENNPNGTCINLSWNYKNPQWVLQKQFDINWADYSTYVNLTTDNEHIYLCYPLSNQPTSIEKYTLDGELVEQFDIPGVNPDGLTWDGNNFYCSNNKELFNIFHLYCLDFANKTVVDSLYVGRQFTLCSYDAENDGFWLYNAFPGKNMTLVNRQGETIMTSPSISLFGNVAGFGNFTAKDGTPHLLIFSSLDEIIDYNISTNIFKNHPSLDMQQRYIKSASMGKYDGKDALFVVADYYEDHYTVLIYEINSQLEQINHYRLYRADSEGHTILLADEITSSSYLDSTWNDIPTGMYRFGISSVFANGVESEIVWSEPIEKTNHGINEHGELPTEQNIQKVLEDGHIVIIKDGKRYTVTGQQLN